MDALQNLLEQVAQLADEHPVPKGAALLGMAAIACVSLIGRIAGRFRRKPEEEPDRVQVRIDAPASARVKVRIDGE